jgi:hypothetical protein
LIRARPNEPRYVAGPGMVYYSSWERNHDASDGSKAVEAFDQYLDRAKANDDFRSFARQFIQRIEKYRKSQGQ